MTRLTEYVTGRLGSGGRRTTAAIVTSTAIVTAGLSWTVAELTQPATPVVPRAVAVTREPTTQLQSAPPVTFAEVAWRDYHGVLLPFGVNDGPRDTRHDLAAGFARTPRGALLAAVHIVVRANAQWGPAVFEPTITRQVIGPDAVALLSTTWDSHNSSFQDFPEGEQGPDAALKRMYVVLEAFRWQAYSPDSASLDLVSAGPGDSNVTVRAVTRIQLQWQEGDWRIVAPPAGTWTGSASPIGSLDGFTRFPNGGG